VWPGAPKARLAKMVCLDPVVAGHGMKESPSSELLSAYLLPLLSLFWFFVDLGLVAFGFK
jgi:hypothetical protein